MEKFFSDPGSLKHYKVCSDHFEEKYYKTKKRKMLTEDAIPMIIKYYIPLAEAPPKRPLPKSFQNRDKKYC